MDLHPGPKGGMSANFACFTCSTRWNAALPPDGSVLFLERTGKISDEERKLFSRGRLPEARPRAAIFELTEDRTFIGLWVVPNASGGNWMAMAWRENADPGKVHIASRLRRNTSGDPSPWSHDEKTSREDVMNLPASDENDEMVFRTTSELAMSIAFGSALRYGPLALDVPALYAARINGPGSKVLEALQRIPGCETMTLSRYGES